jgi:integrase
MSAFVHDWLTQKRPETSRAAMDSYEKTMRAFLEVADDEWRSMLRFGVFTGQRLYDIATLRWGQIDLAREEIRLTVKKTGKGLTLPLAGPLLRHVLTLAAPADPEAPAHPRAFASI